MLRFVGLLVFCLLTNMPVIAVAQSQGIAATVNDAVVSSADLNKRLTMTIISAGLPNNTDAKEKLRLQVLRTLIDENLQTQEASRLSVVVTQADVYNAMRELAVQNKFDPAKFRDALKKDGVPVESLEAQVRAQLSWRGVIEKRLRRQVNVTEDDIDDRLSRLLASAGRPEYNVGEIYLSVEDASADSRVRQFANKLVDQIRAGQSFTALARQFSEGAGAQNGGTLGWVREGDLPTELNEVILKMSQGSVSTPIRGANGYHILAVQNIRHIAADAGATQIDLRQLGIDSSEGESDDDLLALALKAGKDLKNCTDMDKAIAGSSSKMSASLGKLALKDINPQLQKTVINLKTGQTSQPLKIGDSAIILMVCGRELASDGLPSRDEIGTIILRERLDMLQRRYLRDLRSAAYIDIHA